MDAKTLYEHDPVISDCEYCEDCGESASVYRFGVSLCQSCAMTDIDDVNEFEDDPTDTRGPGDE
jgi:hypothetical protein